MSVKYPRANLNNILKLTQIIKDIQLNALNTSQTLIFREI